MAELRKRGFAAMSPEKQRQIASKGGKAAHAKGTAHEFTREEAVEAGRKGGRAAHLPRPGPQHVAIPPPLPPTAAAVESPGPEQTQQASENLTFIF